VSDRTGRVSGWLRRVDGPRGAPLVTLAVGVVSALAGAVSSVGGAALGALLGAGLVLCFFWTGAVPLLLVGGDTSRAGIGLVMLLLTYLLRLFAVFGVLALAAGTDAVDTRWTALTVIACALAWVTAQVALVGRSRVTL
jgi:hypothetical protein